jgi:membrane protein DedA with SNARE-associated domain
MVETYGYLAIFAGAVMEGETALILGGLLSHGGHLFLPWVMLAAFIGALAGDQTFFFLGRVNSRRVLSRYPAWEQRTAKVHRALERYRAPLAIGLRFAYGLRSVIPFAFGMSPIPAGLFFVFNVIGAALWAVIIGLAGYFFGNMLESALGEYRGLEVVAAGMIVAIGLLAWAARQAATRDLKHSK